jgi:hypothetical protein
MPLARHPVQRRRVVPFGLNQLWAAATRSGSPQYAKRKSTGGGASVSAPVLWRLAPTSFPEAQLAEDSLVFTDFLRSILRESVERCAWPVSESTQSGTPRPFLIRLLRIGRTPDVNSGVISGVAVDLQQLLRRKLSVLERFERIVELTDIAGSD